MIAFWVAQSARHGIETYRQHRGRAIGDRFTTRLYEEATGPLRVSHGPQIFSALDQLSPTGRQVATAIWDAHARAVPSAVRLNDPRRVLMRFDLLARLHELGINRFRVWRATDLDQVDRFPVFVRQETDHSGPRSRLLRTHREVAAAIRALRVRGRPLRNLMIVEFCDAAGDGGLYRKYSAFIVAGRIIPCHAMAARSWCVKSGQNQPDEIRIQDELEFIETNPHEDWLRRVFEVAGVGYGRIDYGVAGGEPQAWEINLNPTLGHAPEARRHTDLPPHLKAMRDRVRQRFHERLREAFLAIDADDNGEATSVELSPDLQARLAAEIADRARRQGVLQHLRRLYAHPTLGGPARFAYRKLFPRR